MSFDRIWQYPYELEYPNNSSRGQQTTGWGISHINESNVDPFTGDRSIRDTSANRIFTGISLSPGIDDYRSGLALKTNTSNDSGAYLWAVYIAGNGGSDTPDLDVIWYKNDLALSLRVGGVVRAQASMAEFPWASVFQKNYMHIGVHHIGGTQFVMWINGQEVFNYSNAIVPSDVEQILTGWSSPSGWHPYFQIDDWYFDECAGESAVIPPTYRYLYSNTDGDGTSQDWASKSGGNDWQEVDDTVIDDDDSYVWIGSSGSLEMFNTAAITVLDGHSIVSAIPVSVARKGTAIKASQIQMAVDNGVDPIDYSTAVDLGTWYFEKWGRYLTDPAGAGWTESTFNSNEFGVRSQGTV